MYAALPRSDYYGDYAPRLRHRWTWQFAGFRPPGAQVGVPVFKEETLGAVGGQLYPWLLGLLSVPGQGGSTSNVDVPSRMAQYQPSSVSISASRVNVPYSGFQH